MGLLDHIGINREEKMSIWLLIAHVLSWFFIIWGVRLLILLVLKEKVSGGLFWQAIIMGGFSLLLHYALYKVAVVPLTF